MLKKRMKKHIKEYWVFYAYGLIIVLGVVGIAILNHYAGYPDLSWWRFQK